MYKLAIVDSMRKKKTKLCPMMYYQIDVNNRIVEQFREIVCDELLLTRIHFFINCDHTHVYGAYSVLQQMVLHENRTLS